MSCAYLTFASDAKADTEIYDIWELTVTNSNSYTNPFNFSEIELRATITAPSGQEFSCFGFYDGNGTGGQDGDIWKLRFMPDEAGAWNYTYSWHGTGTKPTGGSGAFSVVDNDTYPGPLRIGSDRAWFFETDRGQQFDFRGYSLHHWLWNASRGGWDPMSSKKSQLVNAINTSVKNKGYNVLMLDGACDPKGFENALESWWDEDHANWKRRYDISTWKAYEYVFNHCKENKIYILPFCGMIHRVAFGNKGLSIEDIKALGRYYVARFGAYYNLFGYSPTFEWRYIWSSSQVNQIMQAVEQRNPSNILLTAHDSSESAVDGWMDFSMRQRHSNDIFRGNIRMYNQSPPRGEVTPPFDELPIIGSEDIWEGAKIGSNPNDWPQNRTETRRASWGIMLAGVMPLYNEWYMHATNRGNRDGEQDVIRMFDFIYSETDYRSYQMLNSLVVRNDRQICSGNPDKEYLVYDDNGGDITINLTSVPSSIEFNLLWFNPINSSTSTGGPINGGVRHTLASPFGTSDTVLLLRSSADTDPPIITSVWAIGDPAKVTVEFSEALDSLSAENTLNYDIDNGVNVISASLDADTVTLTVSPDLLELTTYTLTINNVKDLHENKIRDNTQETYSFVDIPRIPIPGRLEVEDY